MRLITVVIGEPSTKMRNAETTSMLDYGFNTYQIDKVASTKKVIATKKVTGGIDKTANIVPKTDINILNTKLGTKRNVTYKLDLSTINAPVKKGDPIGKIKVIENNKIIMTIDATTTKDINKANILIVYYRNLLDIISGNI